VKSTFNDERLMVWRHVAMLVLICFWCSSPNAK